MFGQVNNYQKNFIIDELPHIKEEAFYDMCKSLKVPFGPGDHP